MPLVSYTVSGRQTNERASTVTSATPPTTHQCRLRARRYCLSSTGPTPSAPAGSARPSLDPGDEATASLRQLVDHHPVVGLEPEGGEDDDEDEPDAEGQRDQADHTEHGGQGSNRQCARAGRPGGGSDGLPDVSVPGEDAHEYPDLDDAEHVDRGR